MLHTRAAFSHRLFPERTGSSGHPEPHTSFCCLGIARSKQKVLPLHPRDRSSLGKRATCLGLRAARKPTIRSGAAPLRKRRALSFGRDRAATQPELSCSFVRGDVWVWGFVIVVGGGCRFGFLGSMSLDFDGKKLAFHESLSLII